MRTYIGFILFLFMGVSHLMASAEQFRSPASVKYSPDGTTLCITDFTHGSIYLVDALGKRIKQEITGFDRPFDLVWIDNNTLAVSEYGSHTIGIVKANSASIQKRIPTVRYPMGMAISKNGQLLVTGFGKSELGVVDVGKNEQVVVIPVWYQPDFVAASPADNLALVANLTPKSSKRGASISLIDLTNNKLKKDIELPFGSTNVRQVAISPDGKWGYVVHTHGRVMLPTSQIERGWVNTNVFSIIDMQKAEVYATLPFDFVNKGAADPWGVTVSPDGKHLYATLAGVNELAIINLHQLHRYLDGSEKPQGLRKSDANAEIASNVWEKVQSNPEKNRYLLMDQFAALYAAGLLERYPLPVTGPRGIIVSSDAKNVVITGYFSGELLWVDAENKKNLASLSLGPQPEITLARKGEMVFHDGTSTLQNWLSCVSCHPAGRADGLNWDLLNDGIGNPKNAKSLLLSHTTPPSMSTGIRANYEVAVSKGFQFIKFNLVDEETEAAVRAYLSEMEPDPSPYLDADGELTPLATKGKALFESKEVGCVRCHSGPYLTDQQLHNVGTKGQYDRRDRFDTPTLIEAWRTAPYLHDGSVENIEDLFSPESGKAHWIGNTEHLKEEDLAALIEYVKSL